MKEPTPLERMEKLTRALVGVPKEELDKKARAYEQRKKKRKGTRKRHAKH